MTHKKVTIADIAQDMGISKSTVSKALSAATDINEQTRMRILTRASELGYYIKKYKPQSQGDFAVFVEGIDYTNIDQFGHEVILGFQMMAGEQNYGVKIIADHDETKFAARFCKEMERGDYKGCFFLGFKADSAYTRELKRFGIPAVILDNGVDTAGVARVGYDSVAGIRQAVQHLYSLGHRCISFLGGEQDSTGITAERRAAFEQAMQQFGLPIGKDSVFYSGYYDTYNPNVVEKIVKTNTTGIVCASDFIAIRTVEKLKQMNLCVPKDISVVGFDDIPAARYCTPAITTVAQNKLQLGKIACHALLLLEQGAPLGDIVLKPEFCLRESTAIAKKIDKKEEKHI
ncbi:MAG: LacI family DNA-binding transcriptional regulator [Oscillospiraceae bacterium]|nr:LacI family DNA-binding transcriptional regulator [Oscillospiraceae bacterium]